MIRLFEIQFNIEAQSTYKAQRHPEAAPSFELAPGVALSSRKSDGNELKDKLVDWKDKGNHFDDLMILIDRGLELCHTRKPLDKN